ncbi:MAG: RNA polymerase sigma factor [Planctomycetota bacterium]
MAHRPSLKNRNAPAGGRNPIRLEEATLVENIKAGHTESYETLVRRYQDRVFNACWRISGHLEDARDLTQEAFLKAFEGIGTFRHQSSFYTWVFRIAVNLALSHRRRESRRPTISLDQPMGTEETQAASLARQVAGDEAQPDRVIGAAEMQGAIAHALQMLELDFRVVVVLRDIEGFGYQEIGEILDIPPGTVKSRLFRARMALREAIGPAMHPRTGSDEASDHD